jgi:hypothetical protein
MKQKARAAIRRIEKLESKVPKRGSELSLCEFRNVTRAQALREAARRGISHLFFFPMNGEPEYLKLENVGGDEIASAYEGTDASVSQLRRVLEMLGGSVLI